MTDSQTKSQAESQRVCLDPNGGIPRLLEIMRRLRDPESGCPWDIEQTYETIAPYTIEEAYEVADAIRQGNWGDLKDELGDLLLQVVYHAQMAEEDGRFSFGDVANSVSDKMVERHPHVFGDESPDKSSAQQTRDWERMKARERESKGKGSGALDGVALALPALTRALKIQKRAARVGFDWPSAEGASEKVLEEARELAEARSAGAQADSEEELGDLLFALVNLARHMKIDPERALQGATAKFARRFGGVERKLAARGKTPQDSSLEEMDALWDEIKEGEGG